MNTLTRPAFHSASPEQANDQPFDIVNTFESIGAGIIHTLESSGADGEQLLPFAPIIEHPFAATIEGISFDANGQLDTFSQQRVADIHDAVHLKDGESVADAYNRVFWLGVKNHFRNRGSQDDNWLIAGGPYNAPEGDDMKDKLKGIINSSAIFTPQIEVADFNEVAHDHVEYLVSVARVNKFAGTQAVQQAQQAA